ncbi:hypothetical protein SprV_0602130000 [Sparganum proliferum]
MSNSKFCFTKVKFSWTERINWPPLLLGLCGFLLHVIAMMMSPGFMVAPEKKKSEKQNFFMKLYEDAYKWSLIKSTAFFGFGIFAFFVIQSEFTAPSESL